ncbi:hypothetical protein AXX17_AT3G12880 [Arabidopsis thaliana]|uniref:Uncharacterized protein n=1 Tax=Arabidopsis thaliana TaxID=3702 RepID=A0A178VGG2_ARATH|nr:hypothetical protein AXX17_AT3G12880 [Arabidopsis thaliana]
MGNRRAPCCDKSQVKRGPWSDEESERLRSFILKNGHQNWRSLPKLAGQSSNHTACFSLFLIFMFFFLHNLFQVSFCLSLYCPSIILILNTLLIDSYP